MTVWANSFEGVPLGAAVTPANSGGASGNSWDAVFSGSGFGTVQADGTHAAHGTRSCMMSTPAGDSVLAQVRWAATIGTLTTSWARGYWWLDEYPAAYYRLHAWETGGGVNCGSVHILPTGQVNFRDTNGVQIEASPITVPLGAWWRIEPWLTGSVAAGQVGISLFTGDLDDPTPTWSWTSPATQETAGPAGEYDFGISHAIAGVAPFWGDDFAISGTGPVGPVTTPVAPSSSGLLAAFFC